MELRWAEPMFSFTIAVCQMMKSQIWRGGCPPTNLTASQISNSKFFFDPAGVDTEKSLGIYIQTELPLVAFVSIKYFAGIKTTGFDVFY